MTASLEFSSIVNQLVALGFDRDVAEQNAAQQLGGRTGKDLLPGQLRVADGERVGVSRPTISFPIRLVLPWSALVSENRRFCARESRIFMTAEYKAARAKIVAIARAAMTIEGTSFPPIERPLSLVARVWVPGNHIHDVPNFAGATANALKKIIFVDDQWLHDVRWIRAGVDVDRPRAEIEISPL